MIYSHSRLQTFEQCRLKFKYRYLDGLDGGGETVESFLGTRVHEALEKLYRDLQHQKPVTLDGLVAWYQEQWAKEWHAGIKIVRAEYTEENYRKMGEGFLKTYWEKHAPFDQARTIGLEHRVLLTLDAEGKYVLQGYIDRLAAADDGTYEIHDYKTGSSLPVREQVEADRQLALYALAVRQNYPGVKDIRLIWHYLAFNHDWTIQKKDEELRALREETIALIRNVEAAKDYPPRQSALCGWCEYRAICPLWKHEAKAEALPANEFRNEPGVALVNRYVQLTEEKKNFLASADAELEKLKEAILAYARREGVKMLRGSDHRLTVWEKDVWEFPGRADPQRAELVALLRKLGVWNDVSALDAYQLSRLLESGKWPTEFVDKILAFARLEHKERLYPRKAENAV